MNKDKTIVLDGNSATLNGCYSFLEAVFIFPITPSSGLTYGVVNYANLNKKNIWGFVPEIHQYQSESGSAAGMHGALQQSLITSTFTSSQGLLLMIPEINKMTGQLLPGVIHVATRSISNRSLSIYGDHQDIYSIRQAGPTMICSSNVQNCHYLGAISYAIAINSSYPVVHFYDGFTTSNQFTNIKLLDETFFKNALDKDKLNCFRNKSLSPMNPMSRGGHLDEDTYFQSLEAQNKHHLKTKEIIKTELKKLSKITNQTFKPFVYYGHEKPDRIIIAMGSVCETIKVSIDKLILDGEKVGLIETIIYRPWILESFLEVIPKSVKKIAVLSRTKENGAAGEPLFVDVVTSVNKLKLNIEVICNGRYGLSGKNTSPKHIKAIYDNLNNKDYKVDFTVGINDDLTFLSLNPDDKFSLNDDKKSKNILIFGLGGDGSLSQAKYITNLYNKNHNKNVQLLSVYNSLKTNNITRSMIRISDKKIVGSYYCEEFDYIVCNFDSIISSVNITKNLKLNGKVLINTNLTKQEFINILPTKIKKTLAARNAKLYIINGSSLSIKYELDNKISFIMTTAFNLINDKLPNNDKFLTNIKKDIPIILNGQPSKLITNNIKALDVVKGFLVKIKVDPKWSTLYFKEVKKEKSYFQFIEDIEKLEGNELPVSSLVEQDGFNLLSGSIKNDNISSKLDKKINKVVPRWLADKCIQCNKCVLVCPHSTIRAHLVSPLEKEKAPEEFETLYAVGAEGYEFRIQVDAENCVGCGLCAKVCPVDALEMVDSDEEHNKHSELTKYLYKEVPYRNEDFAISTYKGATFQYPYIEASGACAGCGETPYYRLLTQLFGNNMLVANATGCSSIFGGHLSSPWAVDSEGLGVAWVNSLFEDNAEFGLGMAIANKYKNKYINEIISKNISSCEPKLKSFLKDILDKKDSFKIIKNRKEIIALINKSKSKNIKKILQFKDEIAKKSLWIIGGDGWAYDIGISGLIHVLNSGENINILVLNTESYANTGGQDSGASINLLSNTTEFMNIRRDLTQLLISNKKAYVAHVSLGMNPNQTIKAFEEAEKYEGPSIVIAYCPCISHKINGGLVNHQISEKEAVLCGYWNIYRYNPDRIKNNINPLIIDFKSPRFDLLPKFLRTEGRYSKQFKKNPEVFSKNVSSLLIELRNNFETLKLIADQEFSNEKVIDVKKIKEIMSWYN